MGRTVGLVASAVFLLAICAYMILANKLPSYAWILIVCGVSAGFSFGLAFGIYLMPPIMRKNLQLWR